MKERALNTERKKWKNHPSGNGVFQLVMHSLKTSAIIFVIIIFVCTGCVRSIGSKQEDPLHASARQAPEDAEKGRWNTEPLQPNHLALARDLVEQRFYAVALVQLAEAVKARPDLPEVFHLMGVCRRESGEFDAALVDFKRALDIAPDFVPAYDGMGMTYGLMGRNEKAMESLKNAVRLDPACADFYNNLGFQCMTMGRLKEAERNFLKSLELFPEFQLARNNLAVCLGLAGRDEEAIILLKRNFPSDVANRNMSAIQWMRSGKQKE